MARKTIRTTNSARHTMSTTTGRAMPRARPRTGDEDESEERESTVSHRDPTQPASHEQTPSVQVPWSEQSRPSSVTQPYSWLT